MTVAQDGELETTEERHFEKLLILMKGKKNLKLDKIIEFVNVFFKSVQNIAWDILNRPLNLDIYFLLH